MVSKYLELSFIWCALHKYKKKSLINPAHHITQLFISEGNLNIVMMNLAFDAMTRKGALKACTNTSRI